MEDNGKTRQTSIPTGLAVTRGEGFALSRRSLLAAAVVMWLPRWMRADSDAAPVLHWKLGEGGDFAVEAVSGTSDAISSRTGHAIWVGQGSSRGLRFDGYSVWFRHAPQAGIALGEAITVMAWVALEAYPVSEAALLQMDAMAGTGFRFSIDRFGYLQCGRHPGDAESLSPKGSGFIWPPAWAGAASRSIAMERRPGIWPIRSATSKLRRASASWSENRLTVR
jgi:hypothetical protein